MFLILAMFFSVFPGHTPLDRRGDGAEDESVAGQSTQHAAGGAAAQQALASPHTEVSFETIILYKYIGQECRPF